MTVPTDAPDVPAPESIDPSAARLQRWTLPVTLLGVLAAMWIWPPVTVDGPAHLLGAKVLASYGDSSLYQQYYRIDWFPVPNLLAGLLLAGLVWATSVAVAHAAFLVGYALALPLALRYAIRGVRPASDWLALAGVPLTFHYLYFYGFYGFCLGMVLCLLTVGYALRRAPGWTPGSTAVLTLLLTATYLAHLVAFALALLFLGSQVLTGARRVRAVALPAVAMLPGLAATAAYLLHTRQGSAPNWEPVANLAVGLISLNTAIVTLAEPERVIAAALGVTLLAAALVAARRGRAALTGDAAAPLLATVLATILYLAAPSSFGIDFGFIDERLSLFPVLFGLVWLGAHRWGRRSIAVLSAAILVCTGALLLVRVPDLNRYDRLAAEYESAAEMIEPGSVLVALRLRSYPPAPGGVRNPGWDPIRHISSGVAARTGSVDLGQYEAYFDYFPTQFRDRDVLAPAYHPTFGGLAVVPPIVDLDAPARAGLPDLDYVLVVGAADADDQDTDADERVAAIREALRAGYRLVGVTRPSGLVQVWAKR